MRLSSCNNQAEFIMWSNWPFDSCPLPLSQNESTSEPIHVIQLFQQRLSHNSTKAHATMPIVIMGSKSLALLGRGSRCLVRRKENVWKHVFELLPSLTPKYLRFQSIKCKTIVTHNNFRHCRVHFYAFVRQPFSKQLYIKHERHCFIRISKHREESWKYDAQRSIFDRIRGVWIADETLFREFEISSQLKQTNE